MDRKISFFEEDGYRYLVYETDNNRINNISINITENGENPHLLEGYYTTDKTLKGEYNVTGCISVVDNLPKFAGRDDVFNVIKKILYVLKELRISLISEPDVLLKKEYIFIEKETDVIKFVGVPDIFEESNSIYDLIQDFLVNTNWKRNEDKSYLNVLINAIKNRNESYDEIISVIEKVLSEPVKYLPVESEANMAIKKAENKVEEPVLLTPPAPQPPVASVAPLPPQPPVEPVTPVPPQPPVTPVPPQPPVAPVPPQPPIAPVPPQPPVAPNNYIQEEQLTSQLSVSMNNSMDDDEDDTFGQTTVLGISNQPMIFPALIRIKNNEKVVINKNEFLIGKEPSKVDYCIFDNSAISRVHAKVLCKNGEFFVVDNNSTNHVYVNGMLIERNSEVRLTHGARVRLGDEDFEFRFQ